MNKLQWNLNQNTVMYIQDNAFENVSATAAIFIVLNVEILAI